MTTDLGSPGGGAETSVLPPVPPGSERFEQAMGEVRDSVRRNFADRLVYGLDVRTAAWFVSQAVADECLRSAGGCRPEPDLDAVADEVEDACRLIVGQHRNRRAALMQGALES